MKWVTTYKKYYTVVTGGETKTSTPKCDEGYNLSGSKCYKTTSSTDTKNIEYSCNTKEGYNLSGTNCVKQVPAYVTENVYSDVTYYRYKERSYISGNKLTEWSTSQNDINLLNKKYTLTGNKNCV